MLTSFFSKSKPINFIFVALYILVFFAIANFQQDFAFSFWQVLKQILTLGILVLSVFILNFISGRNELTGRNAYKSVLFAGFVCMFPEVVRDNDVIVANLFLLLALRRVVSLKSQRETIQKIFDATFWVGIASFFYFWSILFLFLVYFGVLVHVGHRFKNFLVPIISLLTLFSLATAFDLFFTDTFFTFSDWFQPSNFDFSTYGELPVLVPVAFLFALTLWACFFYFGIIQKASANAKTSLFLIFLAALTALAVGIFGSSKDSSELLFFFAPLAIIVTNYFQNLNDKWFKETLLLLVVLMPVLVLLVF